MLKTHVTVSPDTNILEAIDLIVENRISGVCVVDGDKRLVGVLSEMDCLKATLSATYNNSAIGIVADHMTADELITSGPNDDIVDVAQDMLNRKIRRRPVIVDGKLVGQITCRQLLKAVRNF
jgi:CBS domain-containing protein